MSRILSPCSVMMLIVVINAMDAGAAEEIVNWQGTDVKIVVTGAHLNANNTIGLEVVLRNNGKNDFSLAEWGVGLKFRIMAWSLTGQAYPIPASRDEPFSRVFRRIPSKATADYPNLEMQIPDNLTYPFFVQLLKNIGDDKTRVLSAPALIYKKDLDGNKLFVLSLPEQMADLFASDGKAARKDALDSAVVQPEQTSPEDATKQMTRNEIFNASREQGKDNLRHLLLALKMQIDGRNENDASRFPKSITELRELLQDNLKFQCPTRTESALWKCDYTLAPFSLFKDDGAEPHGNRVVLWDNPGNWPDGGMVGFFAGPVKFIQAEPEVWKQVTEALAAGNNKDLIKKYIPEANVDGFFEGDTRDDRVRE